MPPIRDAAARVRAVVPAPPSLHPEWRSILRRSWTLRLSIFAAVLDAADVACSFIPRDASQGRGWLTALAAGVSLAAALARLIAQSNMGASQ